MPQADLFAAVDLGSNSFRLEIGRLENGHLRRIEYLKDTVRQGNGLDAEHQLSAEAMARGWACLARFGERLAGWPAAQVRAVATQTLREARNREVFLQRAQALLGHPIEVITGREEARLIYLGVTHFLPETEERRLVVDIGGRSTELIVGQGHQPRWMQSYPVGSVSWSMQHFADGRWSRAALRTAEVAAQAVLDEALSHCPRSAWDQAYGCSGTVGAVADVLQAQGWPAGRISTQALDWLQAQLLEAGAPERLRLAGLKDDRRPVMAGGLAVLRAVFALLHIDELQVAQGALRHGALFDLLERENPGTDVRARMIGWLAAHFEVDAPHSARVARTALHLFDLLSAGQANDAERRQLHWAAQVHEIGLHIAHSEYHKHGAYILEHTDLAGFTVDELHRLGLLVLGQRGKLRKLGAALDELSMARPLLALRLAVLLGHARRDPDLQGLQLQWAPTRPGFVLQLPGDWAQRYPQSAHLLHEEQIAWGKSPWPLQVLGL